MGGGRGKCRILKSYTARVQSATSVVYRECTVRADRDRGFAKPSIDSHVRRK